MSVCYVWKLHILETILLHGMHLEKVEVKCCFSYRKQNKCVWRISTSDKKLDQ